MKRRFYALMAVFMTAALLLSIIGLAENTDELFAEPAEGIEILTDSTNAELPEEIPESALVILNEYPDEAEGFHFETETMAEASTGEPTDAIPKTDNDTIPSSLRLGVKETYKQLFHEYF